MPFQPQENILTNNESFLSRIRIALVRVANTVVGEALGGGALAAERRAKRHALAMAVQAAPQNYVERFARSVLSLGAMTGGSLVATYNATITDQQLETELLAAWNDIAGVTAEEAATS